MRKFFRILLYIIGSILILIILVIVFLQTRWGKNFVRKQVVSYLHDKLKTEVVIRNFDYSIPDKILLEGVFFRDQKQDTLLNVERLAVNLDMFALIRAKVAVDQLDLEGVNAHIYRNLPDTTFNYTYIINAFAGKSESPAVKEPADTVSKPMQIDVAKVRLKNIRFRYDDATGGTFFAMRLDSLLLRPKKIDLEKMKFTVTEFAVSGLQSYFGMDTSYLPKPPVDTTPASDFQLVVDKIQLHSIGFTFMNKQDSMYFNIGLGQLNGKVNHFGLLQQDVDIEGLNLQDVQSVLVMGKPTKGVTVKPKETEEEPASENNWRVTIANVMFKNVDYAMDNNAQPRQKSGMDYGHLNIRNFSLNADEVLYSPDTISGNLKHMAMAEQSGFSIIEMRTQFLYHSQGALLDKLYLLTPNTVLQDRLEVKYPSLASLEKEMQKMQLNIAVNKSKVGIKDVLYFMAPEQQRQLLPYAGQQLALTANLKGYLNALAINDFYASGLNGTEIALNGKLNGMPDADKLNYNLNIKTLRTTYKDIAPFIPDSVKQQIRIPDWISIAGHISGTTKDYFPDMNIRTADGDATVKGSLKMSPGEGKEQYDLALSTQALNLGRILKMDTLMGKISMTANAKGHSFDVNKMSTTFDARILSAWLMNYDYNNIYLNGNITDKVASVKGNATDPNLSFDLNATADLSNKYPALKADLDLQQFDPQALKLYNDTLKIKTHILADFASLNPDYPDGVLTLLSPQVTLPAAVLNLDSLILSSRPAADSVQHIALNASNILNASLTGHMPLTQIGNAALEHINRHYRISDTSIKAPASYDMDLDASITYRPVLKKFAPDLKPFDSVKINARLDNAALNFNAYIPRIVYGTNKLDSAVVTVRESGDTLRYAASVKKYSQGQFELWYPSVTGRLRADSIYVLANIKDSARNNQFRLGGAISHDITSDSSLTSIRVFKGMLINYEQWNVNPANRIILGNNGFYIRDFELKKDNEAITVSSVAPEFRSPIDLTIRNFSLGNIMSMVSRDTLIADGTLNAKVNLDLRDSFPKIVGDLSIDSLKAYNETIGNITASAKNETENVYEAQLALQGNQNDILLKGNYYLVPVDSNAFNFDLNVNALSLKSLQGLAFGSIRKSSGFIRGNLNIKGTPARPRILGELKTDQLKTTVSMLNAPFLMPAETITFAREGMLFNNFTIKDKNGHDATINGRVRTRDYSRYFLNLKVNTDHWQAISSKKTDYEMFYGNLFMSSNLSITGLATAPKVDGDLTIHDSTKLTYAMIDYGPGISESEGIVRFIDSRDSTWVDSTQLVTRSNNLRLSRSAQLNVNVGIEKSALFNVIIDPVTGDNLPVKGEASLNASMGADGAIGLTGSYELSDGYYELNYNFIRKKFKIQPGSTVTLSGDPLDADVDITAAYSANIAPYELVEKQVDQSELNYYKQRLPFDVLLKMKGKVMKPEITFDIVLPENKANVVTSNVATQVQNKLTEIRNDPSVLNKQVFAALILGRFIADDPFASGAGGGLEYAARQSASRFLSDQLNNIAGQLIQGFELSLGLESSEDYSTGQKSNRTDLNISASKRLFNDRLNITVGNDFQLEGQQAQTQQSSLIPGNLSADYRLTEDGRYLVRAYRVNQLQNIIDGYVIETGVSFRIAIEYNKFKYIFRNRAKAQRRLQERRAEEAKRQQGGVKE